MPPPLASMTDDGSQHESTLFSRQAGDRSPRVGWLGKALQTSRPAPDQYAVTSQRLQSASTHISPKARSDLGKSTTPSSSWISEFSVPSTAGQSSKSSSVSVGVARIRTPRSTPLASSTAAVKRICPRSFAPIGN